MQYRETQRWPVRDAGLVSAVAPTAYGVERAPWGDAAAHHRLRTHVEHRPCLLREQALRPAMLICGTASTGTRPLAPDRNLRQLSDLTRRHHAVAAVTAALPGFDAASLWLTYSPILPPRVTLTSASRTGKRLRARRPHRRALLCRNWAVRSWHCR